MYFVFTASKARYCASLHCGKHFLLALLYKGILPCTVGVFNFSLCVSVCVLVTSVNYEVNAPFVIFICVSRKALVFLINDETEAAKWISALINFFITYICDFPV